MPAETGITSSLTSFSIRAIKEATTEWYGKYCVRGRLVFLVFMRALVNVINIFECLIVNLDRLFNITNRILDNFQTFLLKKDLVLLK